MSRRIASLSSTISMILYALGEADRLVARTTYCLDALANYRAAAPGYDADGAVFSTWERAPAVGGWTIVDSDALIRAAPDLILVSGTCLRYDPSAFSAFCPRIEHLDLRRVADLPPLIRSIGAWIGRQIAADMLAMDFEQRLAAACPVRLPLPRRRVYHEKCICPVPERGTIPPSRVLACGHASPEVINLAGGAAGLVEPGGESRWCDPSEVIDFDPEIILLNRCRSCPVSKHERLESRAGWERVTAVTNGQVHSLSGNIGNVDLLLPSALEEVAAALGSGT